ncbi:hypothetical protein DFQ12_2691 [Sphingobacterium detergens]|uniref:Uncharacterized protein n=1 Tax=Sphingobacterium detergens TaxID=1145106 RepID=A0A420B763_SPHD1|nr:hypothetical protein DFQ12_2691 [Sphingobacterium detergens]
MSIITKNGKKRKAHNLVATGSTYTDAYLDILMVLKKRKAELISVNKVNVLEVAFAFDDDGKFLRKHLMDRMPEIPENFEHITERYSFLLYKQKP